MVLILDGNSKRRLNLFNMFKAFDRSRAVTHRRFSNDLFFFRRAHLFLSYHLIKLALVSRYKAGSGCTFNHYDGLIVLNKTMVAQNTVRTFGVNQVYRRVEDILLHRKIR